MGPEWEAQALNAKGPVSSLAPQVLSTAGCGLSTHYTTTTTSAHLYSGRGTARSKHVSRSSCLGGGHFLQDPKAKTKARGCLEKGPSARTSEGSGKGPSARCQTSCAGNQRRLLQVLQTDNICSEAPQLGLHVKNRKAHSQK